MRALFLAVLLLLAAALPGRAGTVLFDTIHAETAGNADWVIDEDSTGSGYVSPRYPTPPASGITASTPETYWTGACSAWGVALVKLGHSVESLPPGARLTYGDTTNPQDLANYQVLVLPEPNTRFTALERTAIIRFVQDGGGVFCISDHAGSDRNNDGVDSVGIFNQLFSDNGVAANPFGVTINSTNISLTSPYADPDAADPLTNGPIGPAASLKFSNGATFTLSTAANPTVRAAFWSASGQSPANVMAAWGRFGRGRFAALGDSSPMDDGTGAPGNTLYYGWTENGANHSNLILNSTIWLLAAGTDPATPPPNDNFANATVLDPAGTNAAGTNVAATHEPGEPAPLNRPDAAASVWWTLTPAATGTATFTATATSFRPLLAVYTGSALNALTLQGGGYGDSTVTTQVPVTAGVPLRILVDGLNGGTGPIALAYSLPQPPPPVNDNFANATVISFNGSTVTLTGTNVLATSEPGEPLHAGYSGGRSVWWTYTPNANATVTVSTANSDFDTLLAVYTGNVVNALTVVASNANYNNTLQSLVTFQAVGGTPYRIAVDGYAAATGNVQLTASLANPTVVPPNDNFANAAVLTGTTATADPVNTAGATHETGEPTLLGGTRSVWWTWTAPESGAVQVDTIGSSFDTVLAVYTGTAVNALTLVGSDDESGGSGTSKLTFRANEGVTYHIAVDGYSGASGNVVLHLLPGTPTPPYNDNFTSAFSLSGNAPTATAETSFATREPGEPAHAGNPGGGSVWWTFTPVATGTATATTAGSSFDTLLAVYTGDTLAALSPVAANDNDGTLTTSRVSFPVTAGTTYRLAVDGRDGAYGRVNLALTLPAPPAAANDNFANAIVLSGNTATAAPTDNYGATKQTGEPAHAGKSGTHSLWWTWTAPQAGTVQVDTIGSDFDTVLAVYTGTAVNALTAVASDDDSGGNLTSLVTFTATANVTYRIAVDGYSSTSTGHVALHLARTPVARLAATTPAAAERGPVPGAFTVTLDSAPAAALTVNVTLTGSATRGADYLTTPGYDGTGTVPVVLPAGATSATLTVTPRADNDPTEGPETVNAALTTPAAGAGYTVDPANTAATVTIADDTPYDPAWSARLRAAGLTGPLAAPNADPGAFNVPNLLRYAFDLDPLTPAAGLPAVATGAFPDPADNNTSHRFLTITFPRRTDAPGRLAYVVEEAPDLLSWTTSGPVLVTTTAGPTANTERVTYRAARPMDGPLPDTFLRVRVSTLP